jgi:hydrogenase-4 component E
MQFLAILLLFSAFLLTRASRLASAVHILLAQSAIVAAACAVGGLETGSTHMLIAALLTVAVKAGVIPYALFRIVGMLKHEREVNPILSPNESSLAAAAAVVLTYIMIDRTLPGVLSRDAIATSLALVFIGLMLIITRRQAIMQIVGLITMENGLYLLGLSTTHGLPLIIELGIFFDVLVAVSVLVILTFRLKRSFQSTDTSILKRLKG